MKIIVSPTDFSKNAANATDYACALAQEFHSKLILIHVYETPATFTEMPYTSVTDADEAIRSAARAKLEGIQRIVFATDLHEDNINAALSLITFARHFNAEISFVFVDDKHLLHTDESVDVMTKKIRRRVRYEKLSGYIAKNTSITKGIDY